MTSIKKLIRISVLVLVFISICNFTSFYFNKKLAGKEDKVQETERAIRSQEKATHELVLTLLKQIALNDTQQNNADAKNQIGSFQQTQRHLLSLTDTLVRLGVEHSKEIHSYIIDASKEQQQLTALSASLMHKGSNTISQADFGRIFDMEYAYINRLEKTRGIVEAVGSSIKRSFVITNFVYSLSLFLGLAALGIFVMIPMFQEGIKSFKRLQITLENVQRSELLLQSIIDSSPDFIFVKDRENRFQMVNKAMADSLGLTPEYFVGKNDLEVGYDEIVVKGDPEKGLKGYWADDEHVMRTGETLHIREEPNSGRGKEIQYIQTTKLPLKNKDGIIWGLLGFGHNITSLKKKDLLLQSVAKATHHLISNNDLEAAIGQSIQLLGNQLKVDLIYVNKNHLGEDGALYTNELVQWNNKTDALVYTRAMQNHQLDMIPGVINRLKKNEICVSASNQLNDANLRNWLNQRNISSIALLPLMLDEELWGIVSFLHIGVEKQWTETELAILQSFSSTLNAAIKRQSIEKLLIDAKERAEEGSRVKSHFMANMSHELRTPMNAIIGFTDLILTTDLQQNQRDYLQSVSKSAYSLLNIINDILDFSKIEAGKFLIDPAPFSLTEVLEETVELLSVRAKEKGIELACVINPSLPLQLLGDGGRIKQVLLNLIGNSIKFTSIGEVVVEVFPTAKPYETEGIKYLDIAITVQDTGIGIQKEKLDKIFESFTQADSSTTRQYGGTGLGLTISRSLVELMGGTLTVSSEVGRGSIFKIILPFMVVEEKPVLTSAAKPSLREVLVIDDNPTNCKLMQKIFEYLDTNCSTCLSGPEAINLIEQKKARSEYFDLIITDQQMPEMDGIRLVKEIKQRQNGSESFILMLSSLEKIMFQKEIENVGINKFLSKPVKLTEIDRLLSEIFDKSVIPKRNINTPQIQQLNQQFRAIVVEDQEINMLLITEVLRKMNVVAIKAYNGEEALNALDKYEPDVIFMDINMPVMDGFTTTRLIREIPNKKSKIPIIALTADAMAEDKEKCIAAGMNDFIAKPFRLEEIKIVLERHLMNYGSC